mgnify:CR=1 FL=1
MKVYALSDLHTDYPQNLDWVRTLDPVQYGQDLLILAGDVSADLNTLGETLGLLQARFREVFFVPGNHELWVVGSEMDCSLKKYHAVQALCGDLLVRTSPWQCSGLSIVPLLGWYDFSFGQPCRLLRRAWRDFRACRWPDKLADEKSLTDYFLGCNESRLDAVANTVANTVISFSHFLPTLAVMPQRIPAKKRQVYPVLGSVRLGEQLSRLKPDIHVYGHSHVNQSITLGDTRYINNAFAYPTEGNISRKGLHCIWEQGGK